MLGDGQAAAAEFQKFIDHYGLVANFPWGALARLGLARAYALDAAKDPAAEIKRASRIKFLHPLERRRSWPTHPGPSQSRVRQVAIALKIQDR